MSDKERIDKLLQTLMHVKQSLHYLQQMVANPEPRAAIDEIRETIEYVISQNADQIKLDL